MKIYTGGTPRPKIKIKRGRAYKSHILTKKTTKRTRNLRKTAYIAEEEQSKIGKLIPYKR